MLEKIIERYSVFADSVISELNYKRYLNISGIDVGVIEIYLRAENKFGDYEIVKLKFSEIILFRFIELPGTSSLIINGAYLNKENDVITFDFFPLIYSSGNVENANSDLMIKCKKITFEILQSFPNGTKII